MSRFRPVPFDPDAYAKEARRSDPAFRQEYDNLEDEFSALEELLNARRRAGLTQTELAKRMGVSQPVIARIEGNLGSRKQTPSLATLRKYAQACGQRLIIRFEAVK
jgi:DNA-binding XRE family transcriptional regulator